MATPDGPDLLCRSLFQRESAIRKKFSLTFPGISQSVVFRQNDPRGIENLDALGLMLYQSADKGKQKGKNRNAVLERPAGGFSPRKTSVVEVQHV